MINQNQTSLWLGVVLANEWEFGANMFQEEPRLSNANPTTSFTARGMVHCSASSSFALGSIPAMLQQY